MNIYSPDDNPIVKEKKSNGQLHPVEWSHRTRTGMCSIQPLSDEELDRFKDSKLVDSEGKEWDPEKVERQTPYKPLKSL